jgi:CMP-N,N'-diacetyllegionaminic acid synthase
MGGALKRLCSICARGGSQGVPGKNTRLLAGLPLIAHSIRQAQESRLFDHIAVSSDSQEILRIANEYGADLLIERPLEMASNTAPKLPAIQHCSHQAEIMTGMEFDIFCDLDATSPLRTVEDISSVLKVMEAGNCDNVITGTPANRSPYFNLVEETSQGFVQVVKPMNPPLQRRQDAPACHDCNASIYAWNRKTMFTLKEVITPRTKLFVMPPERSRDIDSDLDFEIVEFLMRRRESM